MPVPQRSQINFCNECEQTQELKLYANTDQSEPPAAQVVDMEFRTCHEFSARNFQRCVAANDRDCDSIQLCTFAE